MYGQKCSMIGIKQLAITMPLGINHQIMVYCLGQIDVLLTTKWLSVSPQALAKVTYLAILATVIVITTMLPFMVALYGSRLRFVQGLVTLHTSFILNVQSVMVRVTLQAITLIPIRHLWSWPIQSNQIGWILSHLPISLILVRWTMQLMRILAAHHCRRVSNASIQRFQLLGYVLIINGN